MIALALCWFALFRASVATGDLILRFMNAPPSDEDHWFFSFWTGLLTLACAVLAIVPFAPAYYAAPVLLLALLPRASATQCAPPRYLWPIAAAMTYTASSPVRLYDTALYHQPAIEWMSAQGLVPGLALVHFRFGFTSSWLALTSMFSAGPLASRASVVVTGLALTVVLVQWVSLYRRNNSPETRFYVAGLPCVLLFFFFDSALVSPSPNLAAALVVFIGIWMLLRSPAHAATLLIAAGALAIKLSAAPLLLVSLIRAPRRLRPLALAAALILPPVVANIQTTGCPLFPSTFACSDSPSALPTDRVRAVAYETLNWARYAGFYPADAPYFTLAWLPRNLAVPRNAIVAALALASLAIILIRRQINLATAAAALGALYIYAAAPDPRFGAGFLLALPVLALPALPLPNLSRRTLTAAIVLTVTIGAFIAERISNRNLPDPRYRFTYSRLLVPAPAWTPPHALVTFEHNGVVFHRPAATDRCGAAPLPCTPYPLPPTLHPCGRGYCR